MQDLIFCAIHWHLYSNGLPAVTAVGLAHFSPSKPQAASLWSAWLHYPNLPIGYAHLFSCLFFSLSFWFSSPSLPSQGPCFPPRSLAASFAAAEMAAAKDGAAAGICAPSAWQTLADDLAAEPLPAELPGVRPGQCQPQRPWLPADPAAGSSIYHIVPYTLIPALPLHGCGRTGLSAACDLLLSEPQLPAPLGQQPVKGSSVVVSLKAERLFEELTRWHSRFMGFIFVSHFSSPPQDDNVKASLFWILKGQAATRRDRSRDDGDEKSKSIIVPRQVKERRTYKCFFGSTPRLMPLSFLYSP